MLIFEPNIIGIDEAGRGCLAGPVVAAAVYFPKLEEIIGLNDSKKLSPVKRKSLAIQIKDKSVWSIGLSTVEEIDSINILQASLLAMERAWENLNDMLLPIMIDGNHAPKKLFNVQTIVKGDQKHACIAAASILAKTTRDKIMEQLDELHPLYHFKQHKGYGTSIHLKSIAEFGICIHHRKSFAPVNAIHKLQTCLPLEL